MLVRTVSAALSELLVLVIDIGGIRNLSRFHHENTLLDSDEQNIFGHLYLLDSNTGHSQRLKRRHVASPQEDVQSLRLDLSSVDKVIDIDLQEGSVWDSTSDALLRHGDQAETILPTLGQNCYYSGRIRAGHGYASFSFCNGVNGIIHTNNENYVIEHVTPNTNHDAANGTDDDFPSLAVKITRADDLQSLLMDDTETEEIEALEGDDDVEDVFVDTSDVPMTTGLPTVKTTTPKEDNSKDSSTSNTGRGKATIEVGIYVNANYTNILKGMKIITASQIVDWAINRWNIIRQVYRNTTNIGADVDVKIKRLEIWAKNPEYYASIQPNENIKTHLYTFCKQSPDDDVDHKMMYTWESGKRVVGLAYLGGVCHPKIKCAILMPQRNGVQRELHELGHNLGLPHDPKIPNCTSPYGFMGWQNTTEFKDCYRPLFLASLAKQSRSCLYSSSKLPGQVSVYSEDKLVPADQSLSNIIDKW